jgi:hypothetical protein
MESKRNWNDVSSAHILGSKWNMPQNSLQLHILEMSLKLIILLVTFQLRHIPTIKENTKWIDTISFYLDSAHFLCFIKHDFWKPALFLPWSKEASNLVDPLDRAILSHYDTTETLISLRYALIIMLTSAIYPWEV